MAKKLMQIKNSSHLDRKVIEQNYKKTLRAKAILCKLPIVDMSMNVFHRRARNEKNFLFGTGTPSMIPSIISERKREASNMMSQHLERTLRRSR